MNRTKLESAISAFVKNKKANAAYYDDNWTERNERKAYYQSFTKDKLLAMTEEDFFEYMSRLWSMVMWGNKRFVVDKLIADNGFDALKKQLAELLYGTVQFEKRWNTFLKSVKGMGPSTISELLTYTNPNEYILFNKTTILCYSYLDVPDMPKYNRARSLLRSVRLQRKSPLRSRQPVLRITTCWQLTISCGMKCCRWQKRRSPVIRPL